MIHYFEWDYSAGIVTEYQRNGECKQCGECCTALIRFTFIKPARCKDPRNGGSATSGEGIWQHVRIGRWGYFFQITEIAPGERDCCPCLTEQGLCEKHDNKYGICAKWPLSPRCIQKFENCGYSFKEVNHWKIEKYKANKWKRRS